MKTVLKLVIAAALLNAVVRGADAAFGYYQLKDAAQQAVLFAGSSPSARLHEQILAKAMDLEIPLQPEDLSVRVAAGRRVAEAAYTKPIEFFPNYPYAVRFSFAVDAVAVGALPSDDEAPPRR